MKKAIVVEREGLASRVGLKILASLLAIIHGGGAKVDFNFNSGLAQRAIFENLTDFLSKTS